MQSYSLQEIGESRISGVQNNGESWLFLIMKNILVSGIPGSRGSLVSWILRSCNLSASGIPGSKESRVSGIQGSQESPAFGRPGSLQKIAGGKTSGIQPNEHWEVATCWRDTGDWFLHSSLFSNHCYRTVF